MAATQTLIQKWVNEGKKTGATHVVIAVDTWDYTEYPVYVKPGENVQTIIEEYKHKQDRIMEVYSMSMDIDELECINKIRNTKITLKFWGILG